MNTTIEPTPADEPVIVMTRTFDAPRELVWLALTDPKHVARWYGGHGFENPVCEMDVRPGGLWRHVMRTPDGGEYPLQFVFVEVVRPEKLVWKSSHDGQAGPPASTMTVTLEAAGQQTKWKLVTRFESVAERDRALQMGFTGTLAEGTDKLDAVVKSLRAS